jgi:hypothetical protein
MWRCHSRVIGPQSRHGGAALPGGRVVADHFFFEGFVKGGKEIPHFWEKIWKENNWKIKIIDLEMAPPKIPFWELNTLPFRSVLVRELQVILIK